MIYRFIPLIMHHINKTAACWKD